MRRGVPRLLLLVCILLAPRLGWAHAGLVQTMPADGAVLAASPERLRVQFNEPVSVLVLGLVGPGGVAEALGDVRSEDGSVTAAPAAPLGIGTHVLSWRVISADGHPVAGALVFAVGRHDVARPVAETYDPTVRAALWAARVALYLGLLGGVGGAAFAAWIAPFGRSRGLPVLGAAAAIGLTGLQGLDALGLGLVGLMRSDVWATGAGTSLGLTAALAVAACAVALVRGRIAASLAVILAGAALAASGHAANANPQWLTRPAVFLHIAGLAPWLGALLPLWRALRADPAGAAVERFSAMIPFALAPLLAAGVALAVVQVERVEALWTTSYGILLLAKLAVVAAVLAIALHNRLVLTPAVLREPLAGARRLRRAIAAEAVLMLLVLGIAAAWRFTPPPRALAAPTAPAYTHIHDPRGMADVTMTPGRAGINGIAIVLQTGDFQPLAAREVRITFANPDAGIQPIERQAVLRDGIWRVDTLPLPVAGSWAVGVAVLISDFEQLDLDDVIEVRP